MSCRTCLTISKFIEPSLLDGVGTDKNIISDSLTVSSNECNDLDGSLSYTLTSASQPVFGENPNSTAAPTNPLPIIPTFCDQRFSFFI